MVPPVAVLVIADAAVVLAAFILAVALRFHFDPITDQHVIGEWLPRALAFAAWILLGLLSMGLYRTRQRPTGAELVVRVGLGTTIGAVLNVLFFYAIPALTFGRGVMMIAAGLSMVALVLVRWGLLHFLDLGSMKRRVMVVGAGAQAARLGQLRRKSDRRRFDVVAFVAMSAGEEAQAAGQGLTPVVPMAMAHAIGRVDEIVVALDDRRGIVPTDFLMERKQAGTSISDVIDFLERETERIDLQVLKPSWLLYEKSSQSRFFYRGVSRVFDVAFSLVLLVLALPLLLAAVIGIKLEDGLSAPLVYRQRRVGRDGVVYELFKFRSMRANAEKDTGPKFAATGDARITRTGRIMRRYRIDELPQLINVLRGDMSVVGPRPERPEFVEPLSRRVPFYFYRHCVRPGLTGWAQINFPYGESLQDAEEKLKYDLYYIKNATLVLDFLILVQTLEIVVWGRGTTMSGGRRGIGRVEAPTVEGGAGVCPKGD